MTCIKSYHKSKKNKKSLSIVLFINECKKLCTHLTLQGLVNIKTSVFNSRFLLNFCKHFNAVKIESYSHTPVWGKSIGHHGIQKRRNNKTIGDFQNRQYYVKVVGERTQRSKITPRSHYDIAHLHHPTNVDFLYLVVCET